ncbi:alpha/beta hydrolase [Acetobacter conturbans]|uniref:alpha/beta hydrolase n=1 Tax=Acetobacter conturbans TaxID=1737472 RepID=UPI0030D2D3D5
MSSNHLHSLLSGLRIMAARLRPCIGLVLGAALLSGCAQEPVIHAPSRYAAYARLIPPDRLLTLSDGARIPVRIWPAKGPEKGRILALHGFNDSRDAWEFSAPAFAASGFTVWAPDQRGFGAAPERAGWDGTERLVKDAREELMQMARESATAFGHIPVWLMGESMGGAVAMLAASGPQAPSMAGVILLAPAVWNLGPIGRLPAHLLADIAPEGALSGHELPVHVVATNNIAALRRLYFDPLTLHITHFRALRGLVDLMAQASHAAKSQHVPTLVIYGDRDQFVPPEAMAHAWRHFPAEVRRDLIPGGHHLLLRDREGGRVVDDILSWLDHPDAPLPSGGDVSAAVWAAENGAQPDGPAQGAVQPFPLLPSRLDGAVAP